jgi:hypothetical protein
MGHALAVVGEAQQRGSAGPRRRAEGETILQHITRVDHYALVLVLVFVGINVAIAAPDGRWKSPFVCLFAGAALLTALRVSRSSDRAMRSASLLVTFSLVISVTAAVLDRDTTDGIGLLLTGLLAAAGPIALFRGVRFQERINGQTVAAALSIYLLIGAFFSFVAGAANALGPQYFAQKADPTASDFMYFSFITLATVGYGDFTPATNVGHALAVTESLIGQLYLVSIVALVVGNMGRQRTPRGVEPSASSTGDAD